TPRISRRSRDGSQFRVFDPFGNMLVFFNKHYAPPLYLEAQNHTEEILNQVWFLRDIYANDKAAAKKLDRALEEIKNKTGIEHARLLAARSEIAIAMGELDLSFKLEDTISQIYLPDSELRKYDEELRAPRQLRDWAGIDSGL
ncbi:putative glyoxalase, partial [Paenibacillus agaridevorans]